MDPAVFIWPSWSLIPPPPCLLSILNSQLCHSCQLGTQGWEQWWGHNFCILSLWSGTDPYPVCSVPGLGVVIFREVANQKHVRKKKWWEESPCGQPMYPQPQIFERYCSPPPHSKHSKGASTELEGLWLGQWFHCLRSNHGCWKPWWALPCGRSRHMTNLRLTQRVLGMLEENYTHVPLEQIHVAISVSLGTEPQRTTWVVKNNTYHQFNNNHNLSK